MKLRHCNELNNIPKLPSVLRLTKQIQVPMITSPNELLKFSCKIAGFTTQLISSQCFCCCCCCKIVFLFSSKSSPNQCKTDRFPPKFAQKIPAQLIDFYQSFLSHSCPEKNGHFFREFFSKHPAKFYFLP